MLRMSQRSNQEEFQRQGGLDAAWRHVWLSGGERTLEVDGIGSRGDRATEGYLETRATADGFRRSMAQQAVSRRAHLSRKGDARIRRKQRRRVKLFELPQVERSNRPRHATNDLRQLPQRLDRSACRPPSYC